MTEVRQLRARLGDEHVPPFSRYFTTGDFNGDGPACVANGREPANWQEWDWRATGQPCRVGVALPDGREVWPRAPKRSRNTRLRDFLISGSTIRDKLWDWLREYDPTVAGPQRGLRHVLPVRSHPALVELVGRSGEAAGDLASDDPVVYGQAVGAEQLLKDASALGSGELRPPRRPGAHRQVPGRRSASAAFDGRQGGGRRCLRPARAALHRVRSGVGRPSGQGVVLGALPQEDG